LYTLMLLDDEPILLDGLLHTVDWAAEGFEVVCTAHHGFEGIEQYLDNQPDAIITDIRMRFMDGLDFIRAIRRMDQDVEIAIMSAYDVFDHAQRALELGVSEYLLKPLDPKKIAHCLEQLRVRLDKRRSISYRLKQAEQYLSKQNEELTCLARKRLLLGTAQPEELCYLNLGDLSRPGSWQALLVSSNDTALMGVPIEKMLSAALGPSLTYLALFDDGKVCAVQDVSVSGTPIEGIEACLKRIEDTLGVRAVAALGDEVSALTALDQSFHSAEKRLQMAAIAGIYGLITRSDALFRSERFCYPYDLELTLMRIIPNGTGQQISDWVDALSAFLTGYPDYFSMTIRSAFHRALQRMVEIDGIPLSEYPSWLNRLEMILGLPTGRWEEELKHTLEALVDSLNCPDAGFLGGYLLGLVEEVKRFTLLNLSEPELNLRMAAANLHMSAPYLGRVFKRAAGKSYSNYLNECRIEKARQLLSMNEVRVCDVAQRVGFDNQPYFQVLFKKQVGVTPGDYRSRRSMRGDTP
jgi:two-component system, response regulator YesN